MKPHTDVETVDYMNEEAEHRLISTKLKKMKSKFTLAPRAVLDKLRKHFPQLV